MRAAADSLLLFAQPALDCSCRGLAASLCLACSGLSLLLAARSRPPAATGSRRYSLLYRCSPRLSGSALLAATLVCRLKSATRSHADLLQEICYSHLYCSRLSLILLGFSNYMAASPLLLPALHGHHCYSISQLLSPVSNFTAASVYSCLPSLPLLAAACR